MRRRPAIGSIIIIGGVVMLMLALVGFAVAYSQVIDQTYMELAFVTPGFEYAITGGLETGNETFESYKLMRYIGAGMIGFVLVLAAISRILESTESGISVPGTSNRMISKSLLFLLVFLVFPPMWDISAGAMENVSYWILNPVYSFDDGDPCPSDWSLVDYQEQYNRSRIYLSEQVDDTIDTNNVATMKILCEPRLKVNFVIGSMLRTTEVNRLGSETGVGVIVPDLNALNGTGVTVSQANQWMGSMQTGIQTGSFTEKFLDLFLGLTKALVTIQVLIMSLLIGIMTDMLAGMVIAAMPIFLMLTLVPKADGIANKMIEALPALLLLPMMSAIIISVGAGTIAESAGDVPAGSADVWDYTEVWITSIGVVFFAVTLPVILIPILGTVTQMAQQTISSAISTSTTVAGMAASGGIGGAVGAIRGGQGAGGAALGALGGMARGGLAAHGSVSVPGGILPGNLGGRMDAIYSSMADSGGSTREQQWRADALGRVSGRITADNGNGIWNNRDIITKKDNMGRFANTFGTDYDDTRSPAHNYSRVQNNIDIYNLDEKPGTDVDFMKRYIGDTEYGMRFDGGNNDAGRVNYNTSLLRYLGADEYKKMQRMREFELEAVASKEGGDIIPKEDVNAYKSLKNSEAAKKKEVFDRVYAEHYKDVNRNIATKGHLADVMIIDPKFADPGFCGTMAGVVGAGTIPVGTPSWGAPGQEDVDQNIRNFLHVYGHNPNPKSWRFDGSNVPVQSDIDRAIVDFFSGIRVASQSDIDMAVIAFFNQYRSV